MLFQIEMQESGDVAILDLRGRAIIGGDSEMLSSHIRKLRANGVRNLLLNLTDLIQIDSSSSASLLGPVFRSGVRAEM